MMAVWTSWWLAMDAITVFHNTGTRLVPYDRARARAQSDGGIASSPRLNGEGAPIVLATWAEQRLHASTAEPARMYVKDFDRSGFPEQIVTFYGVASRSRSRCATS